MARAGNLASPQDKNEQVIIGVLSALIIFVAASYFLRHPLAFLFLKLAYYQLWIEGFVYHPYAVYAAKLADLHYHDPFVQQLTIGQAASIESQAGRPFALLFALWLFYVGVRALMNNPRALFRRKMDMNLMLEEKAKHFPAVRPVVGLNLHKTKPFIGDWRVPEDYLRFSLRHGLIQRVVGDTLISPKTPNATVEIDGRLYKRGDWAPAYHRSKIFGNFKIGRVETKKDYDRNHVAEHRFDRERAAEVLIDQLGIPLMEGGAIQIQHWQKWPAQHRALMAVFLMVRFGPGQGVGREAGMKMLEQFNNSFYCPNWRKTGKPAIKISDLDMTGVNQVIATYLGLKYVLKDGEKPYDFPHPKNGRETVNEIRKTIFARHAYLNSLMVALLERCRERGILITPDCLWLRPIDRTLFYALNNDGRNNMKNATALIEGAGPIAHFMVEQKMAAACPEPEIDRAIRGLEQGLTKEGWILGDDSLRYGQSRRRAA